MNSFTFALLSLLGGVLWYGLSALATLGGL